MQLSVILVLLGAPTAWGGAPRIAPSYPGLRFDILGGGGSCTASDDDACPAAPHAARPGGDGTKGQTLLQFTHKLSRNGAQAGQPTAARPALVTFFSVECKHYFDWQTATLYASWKAAGVPGQLVRILSCPVADRENKTRFTDLGWDMHTHVHEPEPSSAVYPPLNKPFGVMSWLTHEGSNLPDDTIIAMVDPDMIFVEESVRQVLVPYLESVANSQDPAWGSDYGYTVRGMRHNAWQVPHYFNISDVAGLQSIGPPVFLTKRRWLQILPEYYRITDEILRNRTLLDLVHDGVGPAPWITEMYGYTLATAEVRHNTSIAVASPPWGATEPLLVHYCHTFHLCDKRFGKAFLSEVDLLDCGLNSSMLEELRPPPAELVESDSCTLCLQNDEVTSASAGCEPPAAKRWSFMAWKHVFETVQSWRRKHCP